jgi:hypothetical protein
MVNHISQWYAPYVVSKDALKRAWERERMAAIKAASYQTTDPTKMERHIMFGIRHAEMKRWLKRELNKHPRKFTPSRDRTTSARKRAGSRKGNGRKTILNDYRRTNWQADVYTWGMARVIES